MQARTLGRTGFAVSSIGYGLWGMGGWTGSDDDQSVRSLQLSVDLGCNFFDTAWAYGQGKSDHLLGRILARNPNARLYAASKVPPLNGKWPASPRYAYRDVFPSEHVVRHADLIRKALGRDCIDLLQFHVWDDSWSDEKEFHDTVSSLKENGRIRAFGLSLNRWEPDNAIKALHTGLVDTVQVIYNIFDQAPEDNLFAVCERLNIGVIARVPLDEGSLGGKLRADTTFPADDWRSSYFNPQNLKNTVERLENLQHDVPSSMALSELALRFVISSPVVSTTIVGMRKPEHVRENLEVGDRGGLPPDLLLKLRKHRWDRHPAPWSD